VVLLDAAIVLMRLRRFDEARQHAELAVRGQPAGAHELLSKIALAKGDGPEAIRQAGLAEQADASVPVLDFVQGFLAHRQGNCAEALPHLMRADTRLQGQPMQMPDLRFYIGDCLARSNRGAEAEPYFLQEMGLYPGNLHAREGLAMLYHSERRDADAEQVIARMLNEAPSPDSYGVAARLYDQFGQPSRAAAARAESRARFGR
jgi:predicted Zn-dependent protease